MEYSYRVSGDFHYYQREPSTPVEGDLWAVEDDGYIKVYTYHSDDWWMVINMEPIADVDAVEITSCDDGGVGISEEIDQLDYQYRIGAL
jgi:hypothetical protein